jgi:hypothetical protein
VRPSCQVQSFCIFAGGSVPGNAATNQVNLFDASKRVWSTATLSTPRQLIAATSSGSIAYFAGGDPSSDLIETFDASSNTWAVYSSVLPLGRYGIAAASVGSRLYFCGGYDSLSRVDVLDVTRLAVCCFPSSLPLLFFFLCWFSR